MRSSRTTGCSFHADGTVVLYPMLAPNRRAERRDEVIARAVSQGRFRTTRTVDLSHREGEHKYLEGTGSLVLDRVRRVAYANLSPRTDLDVLGEFAQQLDYDVVTFEAADGGGAVGVPHQRHDRDRQRASPWSAAGRSRMRAAGRRSRRTLEASGREIIEITLEQMQSFAGNLLELAPPGSRAIALSASAWRSLEPAQRRALERHGRSSPRTSR